MTETALERFAEETGEALAEQMTSGGRDIMVCTVALDGSREAALAAYDLASGDAESLDEHLGEEIAIEHYCAHTVELEPDPETGEITRTVRTVLQTPTGERYACVSAGVFRCLDRLSRFVGPGPWTPPVVVKARAARTRRGFRVLLLDTVTSRSDGKGKK